MSPYGPARSADEAARHADALETIRLACERHGIASGLYVGDGEAARRYLDQGFRIVTASIDYTLIDAGSRRDLETARGSSNGGNGR
jgi:2-keto-3-deoxy-L-rhamnonate aldolase RhmA